jgi:hypothetical protein
MKLVCVYFMIIGHNHPPDIPLVKMPFLWASDASSCGG